MFDFSSRNAQQTYLLTSRFFTSALLFIRLTYLLATTSCVTFSHSLVSFTVIGLHRIAPHSVTDLFCKYFLVHVHEPRQEIVHDRVYFLMSLHTYGFAF